MVLSFKPWFRIFVIVKKFRTQAVDRSFAASLLGMLAVDTIVQTKSLIKPIKLLVIKTILAYIHFQNRDCKKVSILVVDPVSGKVICYDALETALVKLPENR